MAAAQAASLVAAAHWPQATGGRIVLCGRRGLACLARVRAALHGRQPGDEDMLLHSMSGPSRLLFAAIMLVAGEALAAPASSDPPIKVAAGHHRSSIELYVRARRAYEKEAAAYWDLIAEKRRARFAKRRNGETITLDDYVLTQPPLYTGPPRPKGFRMPRDPSRPRLPPIPTVADFLSHAAQQFRFTPDRPSDAAFKQAYARVALAAGLTREQAVRIYAFETGGNGTYDVQAGLTSPRRPGARPISPAVGYNQLLSTNSVSLLAEHGDKFIAVLNEMAVQANGDGRKAMERKIEALQRMVAFSRTVPNKWGEHDRLAKFTPGGMGIHAAVLDRHIGPLLQTQKLMDSVVFARSKGHTRLLTAAELELMNFTGDGNGFDLVTMPLEMRPLVPTSNFFQRGGYERNPIARRTAVVSALFEAIDRKMDRAAQADGARELAQAFRGIALSANGSHALTD
jgi:hypothetical protein